SASPIRRESSAGSTNGSDTGCARCILSTGNEGERSFASCVLEDFRSRQPQKSPPTVADGGRTPPWPSTSLSPSATSTSWGFPDSPRDLNSSNRRMRTRLSGGVAGVLGDCPRPLCRLGGWVDGGVVLACGHG